MMNFFGLLLVFVIVVHGDDKWSVKTKDEGVAAYNKCVDTLKIPISDIIKIEKAMDPINRSIMECVYVDLGFYSVDRGFHVDRIATQFGGDDNVKKTVERCIPQSSDDSPDVQIIKVEECFKTEKVGGYRD